MKKEELIITKDNYKGYAKLYDTYFFDKRDEPRIYKAILGGVFMVDIGFCGVIFSPVPLLFSAVLPLSIGMTIGSVRDIILEKQDELKKQYPNLNYKIPKQELEESLKDAGIVTKDRHGYSSIDIQGFENRIQKYVEEKKTYLEEQKGYFPSLEWNGFSQDKVKKLVKTRRN